MLFNSFPFIFGFLPLALLLFYVAGRLDRTARLAKVTLTLLSLGFYAMWRPIHLPLLLGSIVVNWLVGQRIQTAVAAKRDKAVRAWLILGLGVDLTFLGWFKYANFVADNIAALSGTPVGLAKIALPLGISFFTFQKIAYLIDVARGQTRKIGLLDFSLFAAFFPQLIAGPIVHYREVVPQLQRRLFSRLIWRNVMVGLVIFAIGLFKKTVVADTLSIYANPLFVPNQGHDLSAGWLAAITFTLQLYFDFSGYSDMAIGLGRMLGVKLPLNFHSPLRAASIIDYWRRWHMTLQRLIVAYIFQPLSLPLNRWAAERQLGRWLTFAVGVGAPTLITFIAVGLWHGAGWTFILFGLTHAVYICVNESWREVCKQRNRVLRRQGRQVREPNPAAVFGYHALTLICVAYANVMFRARSVGDALSIWGSMTGFDGLDLTHCAPTIGELAAIAMGVVIVFFLPNTQQIMGRFDPAFNWDEWRNAALAPIRWTWKPTPLGLTFAAGALFLGVVFIERGQAVFLYFKF